MIYLVQASLEFAPEDRFGIVMIILFSYFHALVFFVGLQKLI